LNDDNLKRILQATQTIASVGLSSNPTKDSYSVAAYLISQGYRVIPVNPIATEILGEKAYPDLLAIPEKIDVVQIFRPSSDVPPIVEQAIQIGAKVIWMQVGISQPKAARTAEIAGLQVVMNLCMRATHIRLIGSSAI
jgi:hypothetical protein